MMEFSIFKKRELSLPLQQLREAAIDFEKARNQRDQESRRKAETRLQEAAQQCADIEPTIAYLWLKATESDLESQVRDAWRPREINSLKEWGSLNLTPHIPDLTIFPPSSWALQFTFTLRKPYISEDDTEYYIQDNPVKKEWVFKVPYVAPSQWKGALRAAMVQDLVAKLKNRKIDENEFIEERLQYYRLFGNEKDGTFGFLNRSLAHHLVGETPKDGQGHQEWKEHFEAKVKEVGEAFETKLCERGYRQGDVEGFQGCLHFYPTFFDRIDLEVINPHDRSTGAGSQPIYFECVPAITRDNDGEEVHTTSKFALLYVTLGGLELSPDETENQAAQDLKVLTRGIKAMMTSYGFGAKTSSGFGVAEVDPTAATITPEKLWTHWKKTWEESP